MKKLFRVAVIVLFVFFGFSLVGCSHSEKQESSVQESKIETPNLGMTFQEFKEKYNRQVNERNISQLAMNELHWQDGESDKKFLSFLGDTVVIYGTVDVKTGNLTEISVSCEPKKVRYGEQVVKKAALVYAVAMKVFNPSLTEQDLTKIGNDLGKKLKRRSVINGDFKYSSFVWDDTLYLSIKSANAK